MPDVTFRHGDAEHIDYTPGSGNVNAGTVVLLGNTAGLSCGIADGDLVNNVKASLAVGGFWKGINLNNAANYSVVYWDNSVKKLTTVSTNNAKFGYISEEGGGGANSNCTARHFPWM